MPHNSFKPLSLSVLLSLFIGAFSAVCAQSAAKTQEAKDAYYKKLYVTAIRLSTAAVQANPGDGEAYLCRGLSLCSQEKYKEALKDLERGLELYKSKDADVFYKLAKCYVEVGELGKALTMFDRSIQLYPTADNFRARGEILWELKRQDEAMNDFNKAAKLKPDDYWLLFDRANCNMQIKHWREALKDLDALVRLRPTEGKAYAARAKVYDNLNNKEAAAKDRKRADELGKDAWF